MHSRRPNRSPVFIFADFRGRATISHRESLMKLLSRQTPFSPPMQGRWLRRFAPKTEGLKQITAKFFTKPLSRLRRQLPYRGAKIEFHLTPGSTVGIDPYELFFSATFRRVRCPHRTLKISVQIPTTASGPPPLASMGGLDNFC